ncbi:MAG: recombinase family protein [Pseudomonadota bacterium]
MKVAYARVSTQDQSLDLQIRALQRAGYDQLFTDHGVSGMQTERSGLSDALQTLEDGDTLMVWRLDRLARSMRELTDMVWSLHRRNIRFYSVCEHIDIGSAFGEFQLHMIAAMAHFERALIVERTREGMAAAKARGAQIGRKPALSPQALEEALYLKSQGMGVVDVAAQLGIGRSTLYRYLAEAA